MEKSKLDLIYETVVRLEGKLETNQADAVKIKLDVERLKFWNQVHNWLGGAVSMIALTVFGAWIQTKF